MRKGGGRKKGRKKEKEEEKGKRKKEKGKRKKEKGKRKKKKGKRKKEKRKKEKGKIRSERAECGLAGARRDGTAAAARSRPIDPAAEPKGKVYVCNYTTPSPNRTNQTNRLQDRLSLPPARPPAVGQTRPCAKEASRARPMRPMRSAVRSGELACGPIRNETVSVRPCCC